MKAHEVRTLSFEDSYDRLEEVIRRLEDGTLSLEESIALYEEGVELAVHCGNKLDDAEMRVTELLQEAAEEQGSS
jgi:exodeoxyribonuclease VII small subunit